ncbi:MAG: hypothetical protein K0U72_14735 [Gammaproteobacteria bacterium]|nr:hypothetical protein [Gammaproteobacteria bacterium]
MLDGNASHFEQLQDDVEARTDSVDIRSILSRSDLPLEVRSAAIHYQAERLMDPQLLRFLTVGDQGQPDSGQQSPRLEKRRAALSKHLGSYLMCLTIRLPGVLYTIEIDPAASTIVHWEWQAM